MIRHHYMVGREATDGMALPTRMISIRMVMGMVVGSSIRKEILIVHI